MQQNSKNNTGYQIATTFIKKERNNKKKRRKEEGEKQEKEKKRRRRGTRRRKEEGEKQEEKKKRSRETRRREENKKQRKNMARKQGCGTVKKPTILDRGGVLINGRHVGVLGHEGVFDSLARGVELWRQNISDNFSFISYIKNKKKQRVNICC